MANGKKQAKLAREEKLKRQLERQKKELEKKKKDRKIAAIAAVCFTLILAIIVGGFFSYEAAMDNGKILRSKTALKLDDYNVTGNMLSYFTAEEFSSFREKEGDVSYYGIDVNKPLAEQEKKEGGTWLDYFKNEAISRVTNYLYLCCAADREGFTLGDSDIKEINERVSKITDLSSYGRGINAQDITDALKIEVLAENFEEYKRKSFEYSDGETEKYYAVNREKYDVASYSAFEIAYGGESDVFSTSGEATAAADAICDKSPSDYGELLNTAKETLISLGYPSSYNFTGSAYNRTAKAVSELDENVRKWMYGEDTVPGSLSKAVSDSSVTVYLLNEKPAKDEDYSVDVRHILFKFDNYASSGDALSAAEKVFDEFKNGDGTESSFEKLAEEYNEDSSSLYTSVKRGDMVDTFNDWIFSAERKSGDCDIVETEYGYHIIYFTGRNKSNFLSDITKDMRSEDYDGWFDEFVSSYDDVAESVDSVVKKIEL